MSKHWGPKLKAVLLQQQLSHMGFLDLGSNCFNEHGLRSTWFFFLGKGQGRVNSVAELIAQHYELDYQS